MAAARRFFTRALRYGPAPFGLAAAFTDLALVSLCNSDRLARPMHRSCSPSLAYNRTKPTGRAATTTGTGRRDYDPKAPPRCRAAGPEDSSRTG